MNTLLLAAGQGLRLLPYTSDRPKCLVEVDGHSLLDHQLGVLRAESAPPIVVVGGYRSEQLRRPGWRLLVNERFAETNMVWSLMCAREELAAGAVVAYTDIAYPRAALRALLDSPHDMAVVVDRCWESYWQQRFDRVLDDAESLRLDDAGRIADIGQKPSSLAAIQGQYVGLMKFSGRGAARLLDVYDAGVRAGAINGKPPAQAYMTDLLQSAIRAGCELWPVFIDGGWVEIDTVRDLELPITRDRLSRIWREAGGPA